MAASYPTSTTRPSAFSGPALTYDRDLEFLFDYGNDKSPEQLYYRCPDRKPRNR